jgi:hypothetical protein
MTCSSPEDIQAAYDTWRAGFTKSGDCNLTDNLDDLPEDAVINPDASVTILEFTYIVTGLCTSNECSSSFSAEPCPREFCTYTQGFYGSQKGTVCDLEGETRGHVFTAALLAKGDLVLGTGANTVTFKPGDAAIIKSILPGGGLASFLSGACVPSVNIKCLNLSKQGKINNELLAQTLTLGLNLRINNGFGDVPLVSGKYLTTQEKLYCEEESGGVNMVCTLVNIGTTETPTWCNQMTVDPYSYYKLPVSVLDYMDANGYTMSVMGLYELANKVLGQAITLPQGLTLPAIASAVDMINNAFDGCRIFVGNLEEKITCQDQCPGTKSAQIMAEVNPVFSVYPNPFNDVVTFEFISNKNVRTVLEIHNLLGQKIATLMDRTVKEGILNKVEYQPTDLVPGIYIYRLILGDSVQTGRLIYNK